MLLICVIKNQSNPFAVFVFISIFLLSPDVYMFKDNYGNYKTTCELCSKLTYETPKPRQFASSSYHWQFWTGFKPCSNTSKYLLRINLRTTSADIYMFWDTFEGGENKLKVNNKDTRTASFDVVLISSLLTLSILHTLLWFLYCWLWT